MQTREERYLKLKSIADLARNNQIEALNVKDDSGVSVLDNALDMAAENFEFSIEKIDIVQSLLDKGAKLNKYEDLSLLDSGQWECYRKHYKNIENLVKSNNFTELKTLLETTYPLGDWDSTDTTLIKFAMRVAILTGHKDIVNGLLDVRLPKTGDTFLHAAASEGDISCVNWLIKEGANLNSTNNKGETPLGAAAYKCSFSEKYPAIVEILLKNNADPNLYTNKYYKDLSPLALCVRAGNTKLVSMLLPITRKKDLISETRDFNEESKTWVIGTTARPWYADMLMYAMDHEENVVIELLYLLKGYNVDFNKSSGALDTLLTRAVSTGSKKVAYHLLNHGADPRDEDYLGRTALSLFIRNMKKYKFNCVEPKEILDLFIKCQADVNAADKEGLTPLHEAVIQGNLEMMDYLIEHGANVNCQDKQKRTPLHYAVKLPIGITSRLLARGADFTLTDKDGLTPLQLAEKFQLPDNVTAIQTVIEDANREKQAKIYFENIVRLMEANDITTLKTLMEQQAELKEYRSYCTNNPIYSATRNAILAGHEEVAQVVLDAGLLREYNVESARKEREKVYFETMANLMRGNKVEELTALLKQHPKINYYSYEYIEKKHVLSVLADAISKGYEEVVKLVVDAKYLNESDVDDVRATFYFAKMAELVKAGKVEELQALVVPKARFKELWYNHDTAEVRDAARVAILEGREDILKILLDAGLSPDSCAHKEVDFFVPFGVNPKPLIHFAAQFGSLSMVKLLVEHGAKIYLPNGPRDSYVYDHESRYNCHMHDSAMDAAVQYGRADIVEYLLQCGANANGYCHQGIKHDGLYQERATTFIDKATDLYFDKFDKPAERECYHDIMRSLIKHGARIGTVKEVESIVASELALAATEGNEEAVKNILKLYKVKSQNMLDELPQQAKMLLSSPGSNVLSFVDGKIKSLPISLGPNTCQVILPHDKLLTESLWVKKESDEIANIVSEAEAKHQKFIIIFDSFYQGSIQYLLYDKLDNETDKKMSQLIQSSCDNRMNYAPVIITNRDNIHIIRKLVIKQYEDILNHAMDAAKEHNHPAIAAYLQNRLNEQNINYQDENGDTLLHKAIKNGDGIRRVRDLIQKGANIHLTNNQGMTALHEAARKGNVRVMYELIKHGADIDCQDNSKRTPLHYAAYHDHKYAIKFLLRKGADFTLTEEHRETPLQFGQGDAHHIIREFVTKHTEEVSSKKRKIEQEPSVEEPKHKEQKTGWVHSLKRGLADFGLFTNTKASKTMPDDHPVIRVMKKHS